MAETPKMYTKEEILAFDIKTLEKFAKNLDWKDTTTGYYSTRVHRAKYKDRGFPTSFGSNYNITSRKEYLQKRLLASQQATWNPGVKELVEQEKARKLAEKKAAEKKAAEEYAKQPKVKLKTQVVIELKDHRPKGHTFIIKRENGNVVCTQKQITGDSYAEKNQRVGTKICATAGTFTAEDFQDAIDLISSIEIPKMPASAKGKAKLVVNMSVQLQGSHPLDFSRKGDIIGIRQHDRYSGRALDSLQETDWQFKVSDLQEVVDYMNSTFTVTPKKREEKEEAKAA